MGSSYMFNNTFLMLSVTQMVFMFFAFSNSNAQIIYSHRIHKVMTYLCDYKSDYKSDVITYNWTKCCCYYRAIKWSCFICVHHCNHIKLHLQSQNIEKIKLLDYLGTWRSYGNVCQLMERSLNISWEEEYSLSLLQS